MAQTTIYIIDSTDGSTSFAIQPRTLDGPGGVQRNTDLTLYGNAAPNWGERFNENFYKMLETFACPDKGELGSPVTITAVPQDEGDLGDGFGINNPIEGQPWYNKTNGTLYTFNGTSWSLSGGIGAGTTIEQPQGTQVGELFYNTDTPQLLVWNGAAWVSVADRYVLKAGDSMTGTLDIITNSLTTPDITLQGTGVIATQYLKLFMDKDNVGGATGHIMIGKGAQVEGGGTDLLVIENSGVVSSQLGNYETLVISDPDFTNKKYVDDTIAASIAAGGFVQRVGDTMTGALKMTSTVSTPDPAITFYNRDNDFANGAPATSYPYARTTNRDDAFFNIEADKDDNGGGSGVNTKIILEMLMNGSDAGVMNYYGHPDITGENVIRTPNATVADIASNAKNLTTKEYVDVIAGAGVVNVRAISGTRVNGQTLPAPAGVAENWNQAAWMVGVGHIPTNCGSNNNGLENIRCFTSGGSGTTNPVVTSTYCYAAGNPIQNASFACNYIVVMWE